MAFGLAFALLAPSPADAQCGGFCVYEVATPDMGLSEAGAGARAQDASTAFFNPAGMTRVEKGEHLQGLYAAVFDLSFDANRSKTIPPPDGFGNAGGNAGGFLPGIGGYTVIPLADELGPLEDVRFGLALNGLFGGAAKYDDDWVGRHFITDVELIILNIQPGFAARVTDKLSIGASANILRASLGKFQLIGPLGEKRKADGAEDWGKSFAVGMLFEPREGTRIGARYQYRAKLNLTGGDAPGFEYEFELPQGVNVSLFHQLTENVAVLFDGGWTDWSEFSQNTIAVGPVDVSFDRRWNDTWRLAGGIQYEPCPGWLLTTGYSYDSSPVKDSRRTPDLPVSEQHRFSVGVQHDWSERFSFGLTYTFLWFGNPKVDKVQIPGNTTLDGRYEPAWGQFVGVTVTWRFCSPLPWVECPGKTAEPPPAST